MEEDFSSDSDDDDYVPTEGLAGSEEENSGEDEDILLAETGGDGNDVEGKNGQLLKTKCKRVRKKTAAKKKQNVLQHTTNDTDKADSQNMTLTKNTEDIRKKSDELWADFLKDVGGPKKINNQTNSSTSITAKSISDTRTEKLSNNNNNNTNNNNNSKEVPQKVTIIKEFNFAGETVKVETKVDANSKEAKLFSSSSSSEPSSSSSSSTTSSSSSTTVFKTGVKRPPTSGLNTLLDNLQRKPKMSVLDKSKLDWTGFKKEEGIEEELSQHNRGKNGYLDKVAFLQRSDVRQYEIERDLRMASSRKPI